MITLDKFYDLFNSKNVEEEFYRLTKEYKIKCTEYIQVFGFSMHGIATMEKQNRISPRLKKIVILYLIHEAILGKVFFQKAINLIKTKGE